MIAKKLALAAVVAMLAALFAMALVGCGESSEEAEESEKVLLRESYGVPELPATQGMLELSSERAVKVLSNFEYREHDGEGQWANSAAMFDVQDNGSQATFDSEIEGDEYGWILQLASYESFLWHNYTLENIESGASPERAVLTVFSRNGISFESADEAVVFIDALFYCRTVVIAFDSSEEGGFIEYAVAQNMSGAVCQITQDAPGVFTLCIYPKSSWEDGSYDELVAECQQRAEADSCEYVEFKKRAPLFKKPYLERV